MGNEYSKVGSPLKPVKLSQETLLDMGRLIRAVAEIEDILTLHMCNVADITEGQYLILLGKIGIGAKLGYATLFANSIGGAAKQRTEESFNNEAYKALIKCRNVVAHGVLLGQTDIGKISFRTTDTASPKSGVLGVEVISYGPSDFTAFAEMAEIAIPQIEEALMVADTRAARRE